MTCRRALALGCLLCVAAPVVAADTPVEARIDTRIQARWKADGVTPADQLTDEAFVRRVTLDLVGRIPTVPEVRAYQQSADPTKREKLIDRLIDSPAYARYQAYLFEYMLSDRAGPNGGPLRDYLTAAVAENRPWDRVYRELLVPTDDPKQKGAAEYLRPKLADGDRLTNDVSVAFFGVNISCAQCHDHPLVADWKQAHFYGMKGFLARTYDAGGFVAERSAGLVKYKPNTGPERQAKLMFLTGAVVESDSVRELTKDEQKAEKDAIDRAKTGKKAPPPPTFSARQKLVELSLQPAARGYLSKSIVNRLWHRFFGSGLVEPLDQMHSENPSSHPELLSELAADLESHHNDLRRLVRGIVMSKAYSVASRYGSESQPSAATFAVARVKPLTPWQMATSLKIAATDPRVFDGLSAKDLEKKLGQYESGGRGLMGQFPMPGERFQVGVAEALFFSNGDRLAKEVLAEGKESLVTRLTGEADLDAAVNDLFLAVLNRPAAADEKTAIARYVEARKGQKAEAYRQAVWAVCAGPEFRFNH